AFQRVQVETGPLTVQLDPEHHLQYVAVDEFAAGFRAARATAAGDPMIDRRDGDDRRERFVPGDALTSAETFSAWLAALPGVPIVPEWSARIAVLARPVGHGRVRVSVSIENTSDDPVVMRTVRGEQVPRPDNARDHFLFRAR